MRATLLILLTVLATLPALAQETAPAGEPVLVINPELEPGTQPLEGLKWTNRVLVVFADSDRDPRFARQMNKLADDPGPLLDRDVVVLTDTDPGANGPLRDSLRPRDFMLVLVGKDGTVALRKPDPRSVREVVSVIDKMPLRLQEIAEAKQAAAEAAAAGE